MPPQNNQVPPQTPPSTPPPGSSFSADALKKDPKFMKTVKIFAMYGAILSLVNALVSMIISSLSWSRYYMPFNIGSLIVALIVGAIGSAIAGIIFYFIYEPIHNWVKRTPFLARHIHDIFTLFWKPFIVITVITGVLGLLAILGLGATLVAVTAGYGIPSFGLLFVGWIIGIAVNFGIYYWFTKTISAKLAPLYPW